MIVLAFFAKAVFATECSWGALNLTQLEGLTIDCDFMENSYHLYLKYTPCSNQVFCGPFNGDIYWGMMTQYTDTTCQSFTCRWDNGDTKPLINGTQYTFNYNNGLGDQNCAARGSQITFICDQYAVPYNTAKTQCNESPPCTYNIKIYTYLACN